MRGPEAEVDHLDASGNRIVGASVVDDYELDPHHVRLLTLASEARDRCTQSRAEGDSRIADARLTQSDRQRTGSWDAKRHSRVMVVSRVPMLSRLAGGVDHLVQPLQEVGAIAWIERRLASGDGSHGA